MALSDAGRALEALAPGNGSRGRELPTETPLAGTGLSDIGGSPPLTESKEGTPMKEYRILREVENARIGPNNHKLLEEKINELAREGWVVSSFGVSHAPSTYGPMFSSNAWFCALLERETKAARSR